MRKIGAVLVFMVVILMGVDTSRAEEPSPATPDETEAVRAACLDYVEGWFESNVERVRRGVHPDLVKRRPADNTLQKMTREELIESARRELKEETGLEAEHYEMIFNGLQLSNSVSNERAFIFVARGLRLPLSRIWPDQKHFN